MTHYSLHDLYQLGAYEALTKVAQMPPQGMPPQGMPPQGMPPQGMPAPVGPAMGEVQQDMMPPGQPSPEELQQVQNSGITPGDIQSAAKVIQPHNNNSIGTPMMPQG